MGMSGDQAGPPRHSNRSCQTSIPGLLLALLIEHHQGQQQSVKLSPEGLLKCAFSATAAAPHLAVLDQRRLQLSQRLRWRVMLCQVVQEVQCALDLVLEVFGSRWGHAAGSRRRKGTAFPSSAKRELNFQENKRP